MEMDHTQFPHFWGLVCECSQACEKRIFNSFGDGELIFLMMLVPGLLGIWDYREFVLVLLWHSDC